MRAKKRRRANPILGRDPAHRLLISGAVLSAILAIRFGWLGLTTGRTNMPGAASPDDLATEGFFMAAIVLAGISLVRNVDRPPGLRRLRKGKIWLRMMRRL